MWPSHVLLLSSTYPILYASGLASYIDIHLEEENRMGLTTNTCEIEIAERVIIQAADGGDEVSPPAAVAPPNALGLVQHVRNGR